MSIFQKIDEEITDCLETTYIDKYGLIAILDALEDICYKKGEHLRGNWQDEKMGKNWETVGFEIGKIATKFKGTVT
jgi:hypothetical protein